MCPASPPPPRPGAASLEHPGLAGRGRALVDRGGRAPSPGRRSAGPWSVGGAHAPSSSSSSSSSCIPSSTFAKMTVWLETLWNILQDDACKVRAPPTAAPRLSASERGCVHRALLTHFAPRPAPRPPHHRPSPAPTSAGVHPLERPGRRLHHQLDPCVAAGPPRPRRRRCCPAPTGCCAAREAHRRCPPLTPRPRLLRHSPQASSRRACSPTTTSTA